jgi:hypothetical protein
VTYILEKATKEQAKARWILEGPAGSGKTRTSLAIASGLGSSTALIDTNRRQSLVWAGMFDFDVLHMSTNFHPDQLVEALAQCSAYDTTIVDSGSSFWSGPGGMLEQVELASEGKSGSTFNNGWKTMGPAEKRMIDALLAHPGHLLMTLKVKAEYVVQQGANGKWEPKRVGTKPDQRAGLDYEFGIVSTLDDDHTLRFLKSPYEGFDGRAIERPTADVGAEFLTWLLDGKEAVTAWDLRNEAFEVKTLDDMKALRQRAWHLNMQHAAVTDEHGDASTLEQIIIRLGNALRPAGGAK